MEDRLHVRLGDRGERRISGARTCWASTDRRRRRRKEAEGGRQIRFRRYEPIYNCVLTVGVAGEGREEVDVLGKKQKLVRVELTPTN